MAKVGAFEAKTNLAKYLDLAEAGEEVIITRRGRPVARLVGLEETAEARQARQAEVIRDLQALGARLKGRVTREELTAWKAEGRR